MSIDAINDLTHRYADAVCRGDTDTWASTWAIDAVWNIGRGDRVGREAIRAAYEQAMDLFAHVVQTALNGTAELGETEGHGRRYLMEHSQTRGGRGLFYLGYYDDRYVLTDDGWQFASRRLTWLYQGAPDLSGNWGPPPGYETF